ncbi:autotransporter domain-containing protein [Sporomusa rhizae]|uniref:autotransporter domain-containing protein n=1 Tax=Sporomusa rhizae TaxID=357999 RepID=UPI003529FB26
MKKQGKISARRKRLLQQTIALAFAGCLLNPPGVLAADYTTPITGDSSKDTAYAAATKDYSTYNFDSDTSITVDKNNDKVDVYVFIENEAKGVAALFADNKMLTINAPGKILTLKATDYSDNDGDDDDQSVAGFGLYAGENGNIKVTADKVVVAVPANCNKSAGIEAHGGSITINGLLNLDVSGGDARIRALYAEQGGSISVGGGTIKGRDAVFAYDKGKINVNVVTTNTGVAAGLADTVIDGNIVASYGSSINVALVTDKSSLNGYASMSNFGDTDTGSTLNMWLQNGAVWTNPGKANYNAEELTAFYGGDSEATRGVIVQQAKDEVAPLTIDKYSGNTLVTYTHDQTTPAALKGGAIKIVSADKTKGTNAAITLLTDSSGIDVANDKAMVNGVLNALAEKLIYVNYTTGERNLDGKVEIAEGMTSSSAALRTGSVTFNNITGQGNYLTVINESLGGANAANDYVNRVTGSDGTDTYGIPIPVMVTVNDQNYAGQNAYSNPGIFADVNKKMIINSNYPLTISSTSVYANRYADGITGLDGSSLTINGDVNITAHGLGGAYGIRYTPSGTSEGAQAKLLINGKLTMRNATDANNPWGVYSDGYSYNNNPRWQTTGIFNNQSDGSVIMVTGAVDLAVKGTGAAADDYYDNTFDKSAVVNLLGGGRIITPNATDRTYLALAAYSGTVNMNTGTDGTKPGTNQVKLEGDIFTIHDDSSKKADYKNGKINLALTTSNSYWKGAAQNVGQPLVGDFNLWLQNGAEWTNSPWGAALSDGNGLGDSGFDNVSYVTKFTGGSSKWTRGVIYQAGDTGLYFNNYSGNTLINYGHDAAVPATILGGDTFVESAASGSVITLRTDNSGIDLTNDSAVNNVLNALANKLYYTNYMTGEKNLSGEVEIAEGLTASAAVKKLGSIAFDAASGQGSLNTAKGRTNVYNSIITGAAATDKDYAAVIGQDGVYRFAGDTLITTKIDGSVVTQGVPVFSAIKPSADGQNITIDMGGHDLTIDTDVTCGRSSATPKAVGITADKDATVTINNPGAINVLTRGDYYYVAGLYASDKGKVIINNDNSEEHAVTVNSFLKAPDGLPVTDRNWAINNTGIKVMNGGQLTINGLANVTAVDSWGLSATAKAQLSVGGGTLDTTNYEAIDSYAGGVVNFNVRTNPDGTLSAGTNRGNITGDIKTQGAWVGVGQGGTINVALTTNKSTWTGMADNPALYNGKVPLNGVFNLWLQNGATWTNQLVHTLNISGRPLDLAASRVNSFYGGSSEDTRGLINQTAKNIQIDNYSGHTVVDYAHDAATPTTITGGAITIASASKTNGSNAVITLRTAGTGITDATTVDAVLNALANKLTYTNYISGERNLDGKVEIMEGLTTSSASKKLADITFSEFTGQGGYYKAGAPTEQTTTTTLSGNNISQQVFTKGTTVAVNDAAAQGGIVAAVYASAKPLTIDASGQVLGLTATTTGTDRSTYGLYAAGTGAKTAVTAKELGIKAEGGKNAGLYVGNGAEVGLKADNGTGIVAENGVGILSEGGTLVIDGKVTITAANGTGIKMTGPKTTAKAQLLTASDTVTNDGVINGDLDITAAAGIDMSGGKVLSVTGNTKITASGDDAVKADNGTANLNGGANIIVTAGKNALHTLNGGMIKIAGDKAVNISGNVVNDSGTIDIGLSKNGSLLNGSITTAEGATTKLTLANGGAWGVTGDVASSITELAGGSSKSAKGFIKQASAKEITIDKYSGQVTAIYEHDATAPTNIKGGGITIKSADTGSVFTLSTDNSGINTKDSREVLKVLNALSNKLTYKGAEETKNLSGKVEIAEGLLTSSAGIKVGDITFGTDGNGSCTTVADIENGQPANNTPEIFYGSEQTAMMRGAKSAMVSAAMAWRAENNDLLKRMGDLRLGAGKEDGIWARMYAGKSKYDKEQTYYDNSYRTIQLGYDKAIGISGWRLGAAVSYNDGKSNYERGDGDNSSTSLALYGTWLGEKGHYLDLIMKESRVKSDYKVFNDYGYKLNGDYKAWGTSVSAEYGRRIRQNNGFYYEPQVELTYARLGGDSYNAHSDYLGGTTLRVDQDGMNSLIGRLGIGIGHETAKSSVYAKVSLLHEFCGNFSTSYSAANEPTKETKLDFGDSWWVFQLGGTTKLNNHTSAYANVEKTAGADIKTDWRVDAGVRWTF